MKTRLDFPARIRKHCIVSGECWLWVGARNCCGYGVTGIMIDGVYYKSAHRASYRHFIGPIPEGLHIDHLCKVRNCVNPAHLEAVTIKKNAERADHKTNNSNSKKTECPKGHPLSGSNLLIEKSKLYVHRKCRICKLEANRAAYRRRRSEGARR